MIRINWKKITCLEFTVFILGIVLLFFLTKSHKETFIEERETFIRKTGNDVFDTFYAGIYDELLRNHAKDRFEATHVPLNEDSENIVLDIGSGTGHHVKMLTEANVSSVIGIDISPSMVAIAKKNYPELDFRVADVLNSMLFPPNTFTHISCIYFTIYYIKDKRLFFENCFKWLRPHGTLVLHLVNMNKFDPMIPAANPFVGVSPQAYSPTRITKSAIKFDMFDYNSDFQLNPEINANTLALSRPNVIFKETIKFNNKKKARINEHELYMSSQKSILSAARDVGFILQAQYDMASVEYDYNYLYTLVKPS